jgi:tape measure domain-containing protein
MAQDFPIRVIVDPKPSKQGTQAVKRELKSVEQAGVQAGNRIKTALTGAFAAIGVAKVQALGDAYIGLQNRLRTVTKGVGELKVATEAVFAISNRTRSSVEATTQAFQRFTLATREMGLSQQEVLTFTESVNQAIQLAGVSSTEAQAGLIQFSQGLAAGALRGDEFRSVAEQIPIILDIIQQSTGKTRGELKQMADAGKLTADLIVKAFKQAEQQLGRDYAKAVKTGASNMEVLRNNMIKLLGNIEDTTGLFSGLAKAIGFVAENVDKLVIAVVGLAAVWTRSLLPALAVTAWTKLTGAIGAATTALGSNLKRVEASGPVIRDALGTVIGGTKAATKATIAWGAAVNGVLIVFTAILAFRKELAEFGESLVEGGEGTEQTIKRLTPELNSLRAKLSDLEKGGAKTSSLGPLRKRIALMEAELKTAQDTVAHRERVQRMDEARQARERRVEEKRAEDFERFKNRITSAGEALAAAWEKAGEEVEKRKKQQAEAAKAIREEFAQFEESLDPVLKKQREQLRVEKMLNDAIRVRATSRARANNLLREWIELQREAEMDELMRSAFGSGAPQPGDDSAAVPNPFAADEEINKKLDERIRLARLSNEQRRIELELAAAVAQIEAARGVMGQEEKASLREKITLANELEQAKEKEASAERKRQQELRQRVRLLENFSNQFVDAAFRGREAFADFWRQFLLNIAKAIAQALLLRAILAATGTPAAGAFNPLKLLGFAHGGQFTVGGDGGTDTTPVMFAATRGERVTVETRQQQRENDDAMMMGGGGRAETVNVVMVDDQRAAVAAVLATPEGERAILAVLDRNARRLGR